MLQATFRAHVVPSLLALCLAAVPALSGIAFAQTGMGPLTVHPANPRYFANANGQAVYLTGSHTWSSLQDESMGGFAPIFDFDAYLDFLQAHHHNFIRMWRAEFPQYAYSNDVVYRHATPHPWQVIAGSPDGDPGGGPGGPGGGQIGGPGGAGQGGFGSGLFGSGAGFAPAGDTKNDGTGSDSGSGGIASGITAVYDLTQFNEAYFDRMRTRCIAAGQRGIYISIMLFEGHAINNATEGWAWHPFNSANNTNGINGDSNGDGYGYEINTLAIPAVTAAQEAYVRHVIDTINDLDNVMFEIANESSAGSVAWQNHFVDYIHAYEAGKPKQHPVLFSTPLANVGNAMWASNAEAVSPGTSNANGAYQSNPPANDGAKVIITDTDHLFGCGGSGDWVWKSFTRGLNVIYMDPYYDSSPFCPPPNEGIRTAMGYTAQYAARMNLAGTIPHGELASSGFALANPGTCYLAYAPGGGSINVNLSAVTGTINVEWFNPGTGIATVKPPVNGGATVAFTPPFSGSAVLFLSKTDIDINGDGVVDLTDLLMMINHWGPCPLNAPCVSDLSGDGQVAIDDLLVLLGQWG